MNDQTEPADTHSRLSTTGRVDAVCDAFEDVWRAAVAAGNEPPEIEQFLPQVPRVEQNELFAELLEVEIQLRQEHGQAVAREPYLERFPKRAELIDEVYFRVAEVKLLGEYELFEELGQGGMGRVYRARHRLLGQTFAVKLLPPEYLQHEEKIARFLREIRSIGQLQHPNIVRAPNAGVVAGRYYLVMDLVDGVDLRKLVKHCGRLSVGAACELTRQAALGLQHAHEHGLVHRDIKPANLMLDNTGTVKMLDLGLAKFTAEQRAPDGLSDELTRQGFTMGTLDYMPPEQCEDASHVDIRGDIYSLGCTMFYLLTGRAPYEGKQFDTSRKKMMAHAVAPIPELADHRDDCPEDLDKILTYLMAKDPEDRVDTPGEVADAVGLFADRSEVEELIPKIGEARTAAETDAARKTHGTGVNTQRNSSKRLMDQLRESAKRGRRKPPKWWLALAGAAAGVLLLVLLPLIAAAWWSGWLGGGKTGPLADTASDGAAENAAATPPGEPAGKPPARLPAGPPASPRVEDPRIGELRQQMADEISVLPGLNGEWWFDEMPWLVPFARQAVCNWMLHDELAADQIVSDWKWSNPALDEDTPAATSWLLDRVHAAREGFSDPRNELLDVLLQIRQNDYADPVLHDILAKALAAYERADHRDSWTAVDIHTSAVLEQKLAQISNRLEDVNQARARYQEAIEAYTLGW